MKVTRIVSSRPAVAINHERLLQRLQELGSLGAVAGGGRTRLALTDADRAGRDLVVRWLRETTARVHVDRIGNIIAVLPGRSRRAPIMTGSHIDTVVRAGAYDGCYGVIAAIEVLHAFAAANVQPEVSVAAAIFTNEEGVRFMPDLLGSRVMAGKLALSEALAARDQAGHAVADELERIGYAGSDSSDTPLPACFLELHIEQGPLLEASNVQIGIGEALQGHSWWQVKIEGTANHAGTTPMQLRRDAGAAAMKLATEIMQSAESKATPNVATVGCLSFEPGAINVVPGRASLTFDLRDHRSEELARAESMLLDALKRLEERGFKITAQCSSRAEPVTFDAGLCEEIERMAEELRFATRRMVSGASHDAQMMANVCPSAMIFVPSHRGISHNPAEHTDPDDLVRGADLLLHTILRLQTTLGGSDARPAV